MRWTSISGTITAAGTYNCCDINAYSRELTVTSPSRAVNALSALSDQNFHKVRARQPAVANHCSSESHLYATKNKQLLRKQKSHMRCLCRMRRVRRRMRRSFPHVRARTEFGMCETCNHNTTPSSKQRERARQLSPVHLCHRNRFLLLAMQWFHWQKRR